MLYNTTSEDVSFCNIMKLYKKMIMKHECYSKHIYLQKLSRYKSIFSNVSNMTYIKGYQTGKISVCTCWICRLSCFSIMHWHKYVHKWLFAFVCHRHNDKQMVFERCNAFFHECFYQIDKRMSCDR